MLNNSLTSVHNLMNEPPSYVAIPSIEKETLNRDVIVSDGKVSNEILCIIQAPDSIDLQGLQHPIVHDLEDVMVSSNTEFETLSDDMIILNLHQEQFQSTISARNVSEPTAGQIGQQNHNKYKCLKCDSDFFTNNDYQDHLRLHERQKRFKCSKCSAGYNEENNFKIHMILNHPSGDERSCPICNVTLKHARAAGMKSHLMIHQVEELHSCEKCRAEFEKEDDYVKHMRSHESKQKTVQPFTCSHCKVHFENRNDYRSHISEHQKARKIFTKPKRNRKSCLPKANQFPCSVCEKSFMKISLLERHERIHTGEKPYKCDKCDQCFTQKGTLQMHYDRHSGRKPFVCTMCPAKFTQKGNLKVHIRKTHTFPDKGHKMYKCSHCTCIFKTIGSLNGHVTKVHLKPGAPENLVLNVMMNLKELDKQVNKTASSLSIENGNESEYNSKIEQVVKEVNNDLQNKCLTPDKAYVTLTESSYDGSVRKHVVQHKKVGDVRWYCCEYCPKQCKKPSDLIRHIRMHTREKPFQCEKCPKTFTLKSTLISHMNTHNSHKSFKCKSCDAEFGSSRVLNAHIRKHDFEKLTKWVCTVCKCMFDDFGKALAHKMEEGQSHVIQSVLNTVMKQPLYQTIYGNLTLKPPRSRVPNTGTEPSLIRPFHCAICDARFTRKVNLNRHLRYHAGERKYKCHMCPKTFITSYRLKEHLNFHNNIKNYGCKICNKRFVTSTLLKRHMIIHSTDKPYMCPYCSKHFKTILLSRHHIKVMHKEDVLPEFVGGELVDFTSSSNNLRSPEKQVEVDTETLSSSILIPKSDEHRKSDSLLIQDRTNSQSISNEVINSEYLLKQNDGDYQAVYVTVNDMNLLQNSNLVLDSTLNSPMKLLNAENVIIDGLNVVVINSDTGNDLVDASVHKELEQESLLTYSNSMETLNDLTVTVNDPGTIFDGNTIFQTSSNLNEPKNIFDDANIICMTCNKVFSSFVFFQKHGCEQKTASVATEPSVSADASASTEMVQQELKCKNRESYICHICNEAFSNKLAFKKHLKHHPKQDNYECSVCKTSIGGKTAYLEHMSLHKSSSKSFTCVICVKIFKKASDLKRHLRVHTGEKPFICHICERSFSLKSTMLAHTRTHNPANKEFNCVICNSFYSSKASLRVHMSVHTGQKAYPCHFCKMKFRTSANRKSHEAKKHFSKKTKIAEEPKNKITDVLRSVASEMLMNSDQDSETNRTPQSVLRIDSTIADQEDQTKQSTQIINLDIIPEEISTPTDQITMDPSLLLQQFQMSDIVLTTDANNEINSFILDEVNLLDLNATANNLQIISLPQADEGNGVTISISEVEEKQEKPKNFQCDICNKLYSTKEVLRRHKMNVHGEKVDLSCSKCNKKFKSKATYARHCKTHPEMKLTNQEGTINVTRESLQIDTERDHQPAQVDATGSLLNMKFDLPSATVEDPIFNSLFSIKKV